ncbi:YfbU family protein [Sphingomonas aurantiaca]|uniref:YfbU family protein n=1 Tax=Sphingomonas aurantiaca TaxID=185949 RepID=UPI002FE058AC
MQMTNAERLIGIMLAEIMEEMNLHREIDPTFVKVALINHDEWSIPWKYSYFHNEDSASEDEVLETASILSMMAFIEHSVSELGEVEQAEFLDEDALRFTGFDGNHDRHQGIAHTMVTDLERFSEFRDRATNSHSRGTLMRYRRIRPAYDNEMEGLNGEGLSAEQLRTIVAASRY